MQHLSHVAPGKTVKIISLAGGRGFHARLVSMGLIPGSVIKVLSQAMMGTHIIAHGGCRLAIGRGMAHRIIVSEQQEIITAGGLSDDHSQHA
ncbi:MAG: FeoA domain-containing protein [Deltaproteobacteria bacterium]|nr:FeoA domain-containing protein [Deltaproteobacteria bacterium]